MLIFKGLNMRRSLAFSAILAVSVLMGCSKKDEGTTSTPSAPGGDPILSSQLLTKLPDTTVAFAIFDLQGAGYLRLKRSPWASTLSFGGSAKKYLDQIASTPEGGALKEIKPILTSLEKIGLIGADGTVKIDTMIAQGVWYASLPSADQPDVGLFVSATSGINLKDKLPAIQAAFHDSGNEPKKETFSGAEGFSVNIPIPGKDGAPTKTPVYFAVSEQLMGVALSKSSVDALFGSAATKGYANLSSAPEFAKATGSITSSDPTVMMAYGSVSKALPMLIEMAKKNGQDKDMDVATFPIDSFVWKEFASETTITHKWNVAMNPKSETQTKVLAALENSTLPATAGMAPANSALVISFDGGILRRLDAALPDMVPAEEKAPLQPLLSLKGVTLAIRNNDAGSPFPDTLIYLDSEKPAETLESLKGAIEMGLGSAGMPKIPWQTKEISGTSSSFISTPLGAGLYLAQPVGTSTIVVTTSEKCVKDALAGLKGGASLASIAGEGSKKILAGGAGMALYYINFIELGSLIDGVKGNLAMFTGGSPEFDQYMNTAELKKFGTSSGAVGYHDKIISAGGVMEAVAAK